MCKFRRFHIAIKAERVSQVQGSETSHSPSLLHLWSMYHAAGLFRSLRHLCFFFVLWFVLYFAFIVAISITITCFVFSFDYFFAFCHDHHF
jgi:hypothetical protein